MILKVGKKSKKNIIYKCSRCGNLEAMIKGEIASLCEICSEEKKNKKEQYWKETKKEIIILSKNVRYEFEKNRNLMHKFSDNITAFCGNPYFIYFHIIWFTIWLIYNFTAKTPFDPYPFGMLTLIVSLEAILLATFILISQNRQAEISEKRSELDYQIDIKAEKNTAEIKTLLAKTYNLLKKTSKK